ncbi:hypothetical protein HanIR_Chr15g0762981 [Helianthus annuus]|nr:hypothetical protein HanIR_Chr15g0762981 [Helianthus annuus]
MICFESMETSIFKGKLWQNFSRNQTLRKIIFKQIFISIFLPRFLYKVCQKFLLQDYKYWRLVFVNKSD